MSPSPGASAASGRMIHSMTGFGRGTHHTAAATVTVELRSVNHRFREVVCHLPPALQPYEERARELIQHQLQRGRVTCTGTIQATASRAAPRVDRAVARHYYAQLQQLRRTLHVREPVTLSQVLALPRVLQPEELVAATQLRTAFERALTVAVRALNRMRAREGRTVARELARRLNVIARDRTAIARGAPQVAQHYRARLAQRMQELAPKGVLDAQRLATEVAVFAENADIAEELSRLHGHLAGFRRTLHQPGERGRALDFITQEILRETNTIGSKTRDYAIAERVIAIKGEVEKIREQIQNVE